MAKTVAPPQPSEEFADWGTLRLPYGETLAGGFVTVTYGEQQITGELSPAQVELLLLLNEELQTDCKDGVPPDAKGWRSPDELIPLLNDPLQLIESLRRKVSKINRIFRDAAEGIVPEGEDTRLIETKPRKGLRLRWPLKLDYPGRHATR